MGLIYALGAYLSWGLVVPVHFRLLDAVPATSILAHRIVWSAVLVAGLLVALRRRIRSPFPLAPQHGLLVLSAGLIGVNWLLYLRAVQSGHMLDASLGYFINPLMSVVLGAVVLGERLRPVQAAAVALAAGAVLLAVVVAGHLPWVSLALAASFSLYGLVRKVVGVDAMVGFAAETAVLLPVALIYLVLFAPPVVAGDPGRAGLLVLTGVTTALPLIWFAAAAERLTLATLGLMQYLAPSCLLVLSVAAYGERLEPHRLVLFGLIWLALALYAADAYRAARRARAA
ncbi:EamA family transporter RarD [Methylobacterium sp. J-090]|uniref:EamA family transporter RarD n=1 Tax=Methylobacterium sp. J-090 TaxID=2836666 RepID=UPI001FB9B7C5|nr:EamA family transporter RarD [Methylobacterium sp. J-090]MCJ2079770.1 EamA family transporter RarD [Methylobacterium sp. J-090]